MKFSIIIPTLNEEKYLPILLKALQDQTHKDFEVIVVDGNSEDKTVQVAQRFKRGLDIKIIQSKVRRIAVQRNLGAKNAKNDDLVFFDADVKPRNDFLEKLENILSKTNLDCCSCWNKPMSNNLIFNIIYIINNIFVLKALERISPVALGVFICVKKNIFNIVGGFDENILVADDYDFIGKVHKHGFKYGFLINLQIPFSTRRLVKWGACKFVYQCFIMGYHYFIRGKIPVSVEEKYDFGQHE